MKPTYISNWEAWKKLCEQNEINPYKFVDFGIDMDGGDSRNYEFVDDIPKGGEMSKLKKEELLEWLKYFYTKNVEEMPSHGTATDAYKEIWTILQKPEVTEEWIEEKARELYEMCSYADRTHGFMYTITKVVAEDFIRTLVEKIHGRKKDKL